MTRAAPDPALGPIPARALAVVTCMDCRLDPLAMLGLRPGDAHVLRNAGGIVTDDVLRSLVISQRRLRTRSVVLVQHTECGLLTFTDDEFAAEVAAASGQEPPWRAGAFADLDESVRRGVAELRASAYLAHTGDIRGFVYDVTAGTLREVPDGSVPDDSGSTAPADV